ncbi:MAG: aminotransferase class I/II-fold pyridoxal phosphate-dependent enzyme, partial [Planctomycetota bacterium]
IYGGTYALFKEYLPAKTGLRTTFVPVSDHDAVAQALEETGAAALYVESLANPTLEAADIPALAEIAHARGARLVVDNTFSPMLLCPITHGADIVVHSVTKFISGASDIIAGAVCGPEEFVRSMMDLHTGSLMLLGPTMDPKIAHELTLRLPHLGLRMREHGRRAMTFAQRLEAMGLEVFYPGLESHPQHELCTRLFNEGYGYGGVLTLDMGSVERANALMETLQNEHSFGFMAVSLGYFETLMSAPASSTSSEMSEEDLRKAGVRPGLVRMSVGLTGTLEQRWAQLEDAVERVRASA